MASIIETIPANPIKNGTILVGYGVLNTNTLTRDTYVDNNPDINTIADKYDNRFDDPRYYTGDAAT